MALGTYAVKEADATRTNTETWMLMNEYLYRCRLEQERRLGLRLAAGRKKRVEVHRREAEERKRWVESPGADDVRAGRALNALFDDLTSSPTRRAAALASLAKVPFDRDFVGHVPFGFHGGPLRTFLPDLWDVDCWPTPLQAPALLAARRAYQASLRAVEGMDIARQLAPEHLHTLRSAVDELRAKLVSDVRAGDQRDAAEAFLRGTAVVVDRLLEGYSARDMARTAFRVFGRDGEATLGDLFEFVDTFDMFFHPAINPDQVSFYRVLVDHLLGVKAQALTH